MQLVVDANVLFAALLRSGATRELMLSDRLALYVPEFVFEEFNKHLPELSGRTSVEKEELKEILRDLLLLSKIKIVSSEELKSFVKEAKSISPDPDDVQYFALALKYSCPIWSNEKRLKRQSKISILSTKELLELLE